ncbi:MAG: 3'-5' exonuclease domain-containing protein 2 [bacterium]|nr:3'-5' exonuclease domain-containing protein 2 [bacterium]
MELIKANRLDREYINALSPIQFDGDVVIVDRPELAEAAVQKLKKEPLLGFDTESRPSFKKGELYPVSLLQLATFKTAYLFQLSKAGFSDALAGLLASKKTKKIGVSVKSDIEKLQELKDFNAGGFIDLSEIAKSMGIIQVGARSLTARYLNHRLIKSAQKTNWAKSNLSPKQLKYAACDAWICMEIYPRIMADKTDYRIYIEEDEEKS